MCAVAGACAALMAAGGPAVADEVTVRFPASKDPAIRAAQERLVEAWGERRLQCSVEFAYLLDGSALWTVHAFLTVHALLTACVV